MDQSDLNAIKEFADFVKEFVSSIDVLMNNAGLTSVNFKRSPQDIEFTMAINHFAHFYLTDLLMPLISKTENSRIVNVASLAHGLAKPGPRGDFFFENTRKENYDFGEAYGRSKLANVLFTQKLVVYLHQKGF